MEKIFTVSRTESRSDHVELSDKLKSVKLGEKEMLDILNELGIKSNVTMTNIHLVPRTQINKDNVGYYIKKSTGPGFTDEL